MALIKCRECGKEISDLAKVCPNCGYPMIQQEIISNDTQNNTPNNKLNSLSIGGLVSAIISLFLNFWGIIGIVAIVLSAISLTQISNTGESGKGYAIAGLYIGGVSALYGLWMILSPYM